MRDRFVEVVRGLALLGCALILFVNTAAVTQSSGFGACMAAIRDDVLSILTEAEGDPVRGRVNASGAAWTVDSDLADSFGGAPLDVENDGEAGAYVKVVPTGARTIRIRLMRYGTYPASSTEFVYCGQSAGAAHTILTLDDPIDIVAFDSGPMGASFFCDSGGGKVRVSFMWTLSQNPD